MKNTFHTLFTAFLMLVVNTVNAQSAVNIDVNGFYGIENSISANVNIHQAANYKVEVIAPQNVTDKLKIYVEEGILKLKKKDNSFNWSNDENKITVNVWAPNYSSLTINGSGNIVAKTGIKADDFAIKINGSGDVSIESLNATSLAVKSNGSGDVFVAGGNAVKTAEYSINGSGDIDSDKLSCKNVAAHINGSGDIKVWATDEFSAKITGSGDIEIKGDPKIDAKVVGSGSIKRK